jgi:hypothetical protein
MVPLLPLPSEGMTCDSSFVQVSRDVSVFRLLRGRPGFSVAACAVFLVVHRRAET